MSELKPSSTRQTPASIEPVEWRDGAVRLLDQSLLPWEEVFLDLETPQEVARAILAVAGLGE